MRMAAAGALALAVGGGFGNGFSPRYNTRPKYRTVQVPVDLGGHRLRTSRKVRKARRAKLLNWRGGR